jgi:diguanylate cyclase (GGDEF)-like protein
MLLPLLVTLAGRLREAARAGNVPGRWGGEAFLVALPATAAVEAAAGERVRWAIAAAPVPLEDGPPAVTTSVGVASGAGDGWEGLVRRADTGPSAGLGSSTPEEQNASR